MKARLTQSIDIQLKPSYLLLGLLSMISILTCFIIWQLPIQIITKFVLMGSVTLSSAYYILRDAFRLFANSWLRIEVNSQGQLKLTDKQGQQFAPKLSHTSFIHPFLMILVFERSGLFSGYLPPAIILTDSGNKNQLRHLCVWLRWWRHHDDTGAIDA